MAQHFGRVLLATLISVLAVTACSQNTDGDSGALTEPANGSPSAALVPEGDGDVGYPLTLTTAWGEAVLEERPQRIAALGGDGFELVAALDVVPVVTHEIWMKEQAYPWIFDSMTGYGDDGRAVEVSIEYPADGVYPIEAIASADPDLIISFDDLSESYDELSMIAPVLGVEDASLANDIPWRDSLALVASTLDLASKKDAVIENYEQTFREFRERNPEPAGQTISYVVWYGPEYGVAYMNGAGSDEERFFVDLGFSPNPGAEAFRDERSLSLENLGQVDADILLVSDNSKRFSEFTDSPLFQQLQSVQNHKFVSITNNIMTFTFNGNDYDGNLASAMAGTGPLAGPWSAQQVEMILADVW